MSKKYGRFEIDGVIVEQHPDVVRRVLRDLIIVRCEFLYHKHALEYVAIGDCFDVVSTGEEPPSYDVEVDDDGKITWKRQ